MVCSTGSAKRYSLSYYSYRYIRITGKNGQQHGAAILELPCTDGIPARPRRADCTRICSSSSSIAIAVATLLTAVAEAAEAALVTGKDRAC